MKKNLTYIEKIKYAIELSIEQWVYMVFNNCNKRDAFVYVIKKHKLEFDSIEFDFCSCFLCSMLRVSMSSGRSTAQCCSNCIFWGVAGDSTLPCQQKDSPFQIWHNHPSDSNARDLIEHLKKHLTY